VITKNTVVVVALQLVFFSFWEDSLYLDYP
jgi:hypothetical protein